MLLRCPIALCSPAATAAAPAVRYALLHLPPPPQPELQQAQQAWRCNSCIAEDIRGMWDAQQRAVVARKAVVALGLWYAGEGGCDGGTGSQAGCLPCQTSRGRRPQGPKRWASSSTRGIRGQGVCKGNRGLSKVSIDDLSKVRRRDRHSAWVRRILRPQGGR